MKIKEIQEAKDGFIPDLEFINKELSKVIRKVTRLKERMYVREEWHGESAMLSVNFDNTLFPPERVTDDLHQRMINTYLENNFQVSQLEKIQEDLQSFIMLLDGSKMCEVDILSADKIIVKNCAE